ncbi:hypothetical protein AWB78_01444 [Caballeronia calidae]|uniref:Uncharacterized protein n=1 Tax=Caballeronia calidae TaxID=1777139 RepID=A0A158ABM5_9BURK|nr:hypothetical protein AWB78_01444 [Caballeronia calidae]
MRILQKRTSTTALLPVVRTEQVAMANVASVPRTGPTMALTPPTAAEAARTCQQLRTTAVSIFRKHYWP